MTNRELIRQDQLSARLTRMPAGAGERHGIEQLPRHTCATVCRAAEARATADAMHDAVGKRTMLRIAAGYEKMARHAAMLASTRLPTEESGAGPD